jgi:hypothetical protein
MDLVYQVNRFTGELHAFKQPDENVSILHFGDVSTGDILHSVKAEEEVIKNNDRSDVQKAIDKTSIRGDRNVQGHIAILKKKTNDAPVPEPEKDMTITENVDYKDILLNNIRDRYNKFNGDRTIINAVKKKANEEFAEWAKNKNSALANVDNLLGGTDLISNTNKLPTVNPLFQLPEEDDEVDLNKPNLIPTQLKEIMKKTINNVREETKEAKEAKNVLGVPQTIMSTEYDNLTGNTSNFGTFQQKPLKTFDIGAY